MIVTAVQGNIHDDPEGIGAQVAKVHTERVILPGEALVKRVQRLTTDHGTELGVRLPAGSPDLRDGDVLSLEEDNAIIVTAEPTDILVISPRDIHEMGTVAHALGNRHLPAQFPEQTMVVAFDQTVVDYLKHHGVPYAREERVLPVPFRHAEHTH